jgi:hypothetical protein
MKSGDPKAAAMIFPPWRTSPEKHSAKHNPKRKEKRHAAHGPDNIGIRI